MNGKSYRSGLLTAHKYFVPFSARTVLVGADFVVVFLWQKQCFVSIWGRESGAAVVKPWGWW